jgi:hypothetical protein
MGYSLPALENTRYGDGSGGASILFVRCKTSMQPYWIVFPTDKAVLVVLNSICDHKNPICHNVYEMS